MPVQTILSAVNLTSRIIDCWLGWGSWTSGGRLTLPHWFLATPQLGISAELFHFPGAKNPQYVLLSKGSEQATKALQRATEASECGKQLSNLWISGWVEWQGNLSNPCFQCFQLSHFWKIFNFISSLREQLKDNIIPARSSYHWRFFEPELNETAKALLTMSFRRENMSRAMNAAVSGPVLASDMVCIESRENSHRAKYGP